MTTEACNYCGQPILWLDTVNGSRMPVNAQPDPRHGNIALVGRQAAVLGRAKARAARAAGHQLHIHHRLACPHADRWARPR